MANPLLEAVGELLLVAVDCAISIDDDSTKRKTVAIVGILALVGAVVLFIIGMF